VPKRSKPLAQRPGWRNLSSSAQARLWCGRGTAAHGVLTWHGGDEYKIRSWELIPLFYRFQLLSAVHLHTQRIHAALPPGPNSDRPEQGQIWKEERRERWRAI